MADTIRMKESVTLQHQANLGEEIEEVEFEEGEELTVLQEWESAWLAKNADGKIFNVRKALAQKA